MNFQSVPLSKSSDLRTTTIYPTAPISLAIPVLDTRKGSRIFIYTDLPARGVGVPRD